MTTIGSIDLAPAGLELTPFTKVNGIRRGELTPLLLLFSWSFCQAGFTGQQHIRLHCDNCIFIMKKTIQTQFHKEKKEKRKKHPQIQRTQFSEY